MRLRARWLASKEAQRTRLQHQPKCKAVRFWHWRVLTNITGILKRSGAVNQSELLLLVNPPLLSKNVYFLFQYFLIIFVSPLSTLSVQNIRNTFLILSCTAFCPQNSLNLSEHGLQGVRSIGGPQCVPQLCQVGWMSFGW